MSMLYILDASALIAYLTREDKEQKVAGLFEQALKKDKPLFISAVNWAEVAFKIKQFKGEPFWHQLRDDLKAHPLRIVEISAHIAELAAQLKYQYKLGLADAFAASLAKEHQAILVTKDFDFKAVEKIIKIVWL